MYTTGVVCCMYLRVLLRVKGAGWRRLRGSRKLLVSVDMEVGRGEGNEDGMGEDGEGDVLLFKPDGM